MTAKTIRPYNHQIQPSSQDSLRQWLNIELQNIQNTLNDVAAAIKQIQTFSGVS